MLNWRDGAERYKILNKMYFTAVTHTIIKYISTE